MRRPQPATAPPKENIPTRAMGKPVDGSCVSPPFVVPAATLWYADCVACVEGEGETVVLRPKTAEGKGFREGTATTSGEEEGWEVLLPLNLCVSKK